MPPQLQAVEVEKAANPYLGPQPFTLKEADRFFGRDREAAELCSLVAAHRTVLLYAPSGTGKSSLLNAKVVPLLEERGFEVLPKAQVSGRTREQSSETADNIYAFNAAGYWGGGASGPHMLADVLASRPRTRDEFGEALPRVAVFDQFEELFTSYPERWRERTGFFEQLDEAMAADPKLRILFAMREDYIAHIDAYEELLPEEFRTRYRLEQLREEAALAAVQCPLKGTGISFGPGVAELLVKDLLRTPVAPADAAVVQHAAVRQSNAATYVVGEFVEPVQLQVVCFSLYRNLPPGTTEITEKQVETFGDVDQALKEFYQSALQETSRKTGVDEDSLRQWFESKLITESGARGLVFRGENATGGMSNAAVDVLDELHIIRAEVRGTNRWYELSHDRFVQPILRANDSWRTRMQAEEKRRQEEEKQKLVSKTQLLWAGLIAAMLLVAAVTGLFIYARREQKEADRQRNEAETQRREAIRQAQQADASKQTAELATKESNEQGRKAVIAEQMALNQAQRAEAARKEAERQQGIAFDQKVEADSQRKAAEQLRWTDIWKVLAYEAPRQAEEGDDDRSALLAREAFLLYRAFPGQGAMLVDHALFSLSSLGNFQHVLHGHDAAVSSVSFSPDGRWVASASEDNTVRIWNLRQPNAKPQVLRGHNSIVTSVTFSRDGQRLASGSWDNDVLVWDLRQPDNPPLVLRGHERPVTSVAFSPDGQRLASGSWDTTVRVWSLQRPEAQPVVLKSHTKDIASTREDINSVAFSPDGRRVASGGEDGNVRIWDLNQPEAPPMVLGGAPNAIESVAFSPDGQRLASAVYDSIVLLWSLRKPSADPLMFKVSEGEGYVGELHSIAFDPEGKRLACASEDGIIRIWDSRSPDASPLVLKGHEGDVNSVAFSPDGKSLASGGFDKTVRIWELSRPKSAPFSFDSSEILESVTFDPHGQKLAVGGWSGTTKVWDLQSPDREPMMLKGHKDFVYSVAFSPDGKRLASGSDDGTVLVWDWHQPKATPEVLRSEERINSVGFSPDGQKVAAAGHDVRIWDLRQPQVPPLVLEGQSLVAFHPDGHSLASLCEATGDICIWDLRQPQSERLVLEGHEDGIRAIAFSPDGHKLAFGGEGRTIQVRDLGNPKGETLLLTGHLDSVNSIAFSPDGQRLASGSKDNTIRLWNLLQPGPPEVLRTLVNTVTSVSISPDGRELAAVGSDGTVRVWHMPSDLAEIVCKDVWRNLSMDEWKQFVGEDVPYKRTCPNLPSGEGAPADAPAEK